MALNKTILKAAIKDALDYDSDKDVDPAEARERQAEKIANAIDGYIKDGVVRVTVSGTTGIGKVE